MEPMERCFVCVCAINEKDGLCMAQFQIGMFCKAKSYMLTFNRTNNLPIKSRNTFIPKVCFFF